VNVDMALEPFSRINPCGYAGLRTVDLRSLGIPVEPSEVSLRLAQRLETLLSA
jgi:lipoyl(octanoyl) transferase